ncbi:GxxExxY protein [Olivibacter sitiensis]|uniref:GxxExxY protein n=1 Tax=Olivibacter sitiensis TaxID=376470 RepID=UPI000686565B|nr:GxxExxY protein [Olivibacter sitiensis]
MKYQDLTHKIIGAAMEVHKHLGNGFQEVVYQRALSIEFNLQGIAHEREKEMSLQYKGHDVGTRRVDFFVEDQIMVEIKAVINLEDVHLAQAMNYVEAYNMEIGLLLNFGAKSLQFKRVHNNNLIKQSSHQDNQTNQGLDGYGNPNIKTISGI